MLVLAFISELTIPGQPLEAWSRTWTRCQVTLCSFATAFTHESKALNLRWVRGFYVHVDAIISTMTRAILEVAAQSSVIPTHIGWIGTSASLSTSTTFSAIATPRRRTL